MITCHWNYFLSLDLVQEFSHVKDLTTKAQKVKAGKISWPECLVRWVVRLHWDRDGGWGSGRRPLFKV